MTNSAHQKIVEMLGLAIVFSLAGFGFLQGEVIDKVLMIISFFVVMSEIGSVVEFFVFAIDRLMGYRKKAQNTKNSIITFFAFLFVVVSMFALAKENMILLHKNIMFVASFFLAVKVMYYGG